MADIAVMESGKLDIGRVIGDTFRVLGRNFVTFSVLGLVLSGLPLAVFTYFQTTMVGVGGGTFDTILWMIAGGLAITITTAILQGTLIYATVQDMAGAKPSIVDSLATGLRAFLPLVVVSILFTLAVFFGLILLIVPGIMIGVAWCICIPALVAERTGIFGSFNRSAELTRGIRWRIFGLAIIVWIILLVFGLILGAIAGVNILAQMGEGPEAMQAAALSPLNIVVNVIQSTISSVLTSTGIAVLYVELRKAREGMGPRWLADIFS